MGTILRVGSVILMFAVAGGAIASAEQITPQEAIKAQYKVLAAAVSKKDAPAAGRIFTSDAQFRSSGPNGSDRVTSRDSIVKLWQSLFERGISAFEPVTINITPNGAALAEQGSYQFKGKDGSVVETGTYEATWIGDAGQWRIQRLVCVGK